MSDLNPRWQQFTLIQRKGSIQRMERIVRLVGRIGISVLEVVVMLRVIANQ